MINAAYADGEQGMWQPGTTRVFEDEVRALLAAGELLVLRRDGELAGCVRVHRVGPATAELGLLSAARRDSGVGGELIALAETWARERGLARMRLTLLVPRTGTHPFKARLHAWYSALGYQVIARGDFADELPEPAALLTTAYRPPEVLAVAWSGDHRGGDAQALASGGLRPRGPVQPRADLALGGVVGHVRAPAHPRGHLRPRGSASDG